MKIASSFGALSVFAVAILGLAIGFQPSAKTQAAAPASADTKPVEPDMHEFMEYAFEPGYKRLKAAMAAEPADKGAWKGIKGDSLTLAEAANLLIMRAPDKDSKEWTEMSIAVREAGGSLYQAAKKKDYKDARQHFETMLKKCNACHDHFADGEHQLSP